MASADPRKPAVSASTTGQPPRSRWTSITSRVVPAVSDTIAASRRARRLSSEDLPALGGPMIAIDSPSRRPLAAAILQVSRDLGAQPGNGDAYLVGQALRQILVGEVDGRLEMGERAQTLAAPVLVEAVQRAFHLLQRLPPLRPRSRPPPGRRCPRPR